MNTEIPKPFFLSSTETSQESIDEGGFVAETPSIQPSQQQQLKHQSIGDTTEQVYVQIESLYC